LNEFILSKITPTIVLSGASLAWVSNIVNTYGGVVKYFDLADFGWVGFPPCNPKISDFYPKKQVNIESVIMSPILIYFKTINNNVLKIENTTFQ